MRRLVTLLVGTVLAGCLGLALAASAAGAMGGNAARDLATDTRAARGGHVVVVGVPGLLWSDLSSTGTPDLWRLLGHGAAGALSVRSASDITCPDDGWLTLGAGNRARGPVRRDGGCAGLLTPVRAEAGGALVAGFSALRHENNRLDEGANLGALGGAAEAAGACVAAGGPGAAVAAADPSGRVWVYEADPQAAAADGGFLTRCPVTILAATPATAGATAARVVRAAPQGTTVIVVGVGDVSASPVAHLHVGIASGPSFDGGTLISASTRRAPYVQLVDVAPTVLGITGIPAPSSMIGQPMRASGSGPASAADRVRMLTDLDLAARVQAHAVAPFYALVVGFEIVAIGLAWVATRRRRVRLASVAAAALTAGMCLLGGSFLANALPWWRAGAPLLSLLGGTAIASAGLTALAYAGPWRRRPLGAPGVAALLIALIIGVDLLTGARLQMFAPAGYSPLVAGRFAGIGNVAFGVFGTASVLAVAALAAGRSRRGAATIVAIGGAVTVLIDGGPPWGSDVGGVLALVPAFVILGLLVTGARLSWRHLALAVLGAIAVVFALAAVDYSRPASERTHLGRFFGQVLHGDEGTVLRRKALANWHLVTHSAFTVLIPVLLLVAIWLIARPPDTLRRAFERLPALRHGLVAAVVLSVVGFAVNDSGVAVPALALLVAVPLAVASIVRTNRIGPTPRGEERDPPRVLR